MSTNFVFDNTHIDTHTYYERYEAVKSLCSFVDSDADYVSNLGKLFEFICDYWEKVAKEECIGVQLLILNEIEEITRNLRASIDNNPELAFDLFTYMLFQAIWGFLLDLRIKLQENPSDPNNELLNNLTNDIMAKLVLSNSRK